MEDSFPLADSLVLKLGSVVEGTAALATLLANNSSIASLIQDAPGNEPVKPLNSYMTGGLFVALRLLAAQAFELTWEIADRQNQAARRAGQGNAVADDERKAA